MRKLILTGIVALTGVLSAQAQEGISKNAIGLRFGHNDGMGAEVSYQRLLSDDNRLEIDLGWRNANHYDAIKATGVYQWVWNIEGGFHWYAGVGAGLGSWSYDYYVGNGNRYKENDLFLFAAGQIGVEYNFDFPLQVFADFRPELYLINNDYHDSFGPDFAVGARFKF